MHGLDHIGQTDHLADMLVLEEILLQRLDPAQQFRLHEQLQGRAPAIDKQPDVIPDERIVEFQAALLDYRQGLVIQGFGGVDFDSADPRRGLIPFRLAALGRLLAQRLE